MAKKVVSADELMKSAGSIRESDLSVYACPICKSEKAWDFDHESNYVLARMSGKSMVDGAKVVHEVVAKNGDMVVRAVCSNCGFVALFKRGIGPS